MNTRDPRWHVRIRGLHKQFGDHPEVLRGMDVDFERGKVNLIVGASGSGKSVLLKHIAGLIKPTSGQIWVDGVDVAKLDRRGAEAYSRKVGFLFQSTALFDSITVEENVAFPLTEHTKLSAKEIHVRAQTMLERLGVGAAGKKLPAELSGGMRKRVALARALMLEPELMLYDEPMTGLDPMATASVNELIMNVASERSATSIVISHDMSSVFHMADRIVMIRDGAIEAVGTPDEVRAHPSAYVRSFLVASGVVAAQPFPQIAGPSAASTTGGKGDLVQALPITS